MLKSLLPFRFSFASLNYFSCSMNEQLIGMTDNLGRYLLRELRILLDVACMLAFRSYVASLLVKDVSINSWIDASPSGGRESC